MKFRIYNVIKINILLLLIFVSYYLINKYTGLYIPCIFRIITGLKCPGCGITHVLFSLINFDIKNAFISNPLVFIYLPFIVIYYIYNCYIYIYNKEDKVLVKISNYIWITIIMVTLAFGIVRNVVGI